MHDLVQSVYSMIHNSLNHNVLAPAPMVGGLQILSICPSLNSSLLQQRTCRIFKTGYVCETRTESTSPNHQKVMSYGLQLVIKRPLVSIRNIFGFAQRSKLSNDIFTLRALFLTYIKSTTQKLFILNHFLKKCFSLLEIFGPFYLDTFKHLLRANNQVYTLSRFKIVPRYVTSE